MHSHTPDHATTKVSVMASRSPTKAGPGKDRLLTFLETCLDAESDKTFVPLLTVDDLENLRSLNKAWKSSKKLEWALHGAGIRYVKDRCDFPGAGLQGPCVHTPTTRPSELQWCTMHAQLQARHHRGSTLLMCPSHVGDLAPGTTLRGHSGPMCVLCQASLELDDIMDELIASERRVDEVLRATAG